MLRLYDSRNPNVPQSRFRRAHENRLSIPTLMESYIDISLHVWLVGKRYHDLNNTNASVVLNAYGGVKFIWYARKQPSI
jgi:hypothetical protein